MSNARHTPGPWFVSDRPHSYGREVSAGSPGGQVIAGGNGAPWPDLFEQQANAKLIAAAPDLLAALQGVLRVADRKTDEFDAARAAIAKATGN